MKTNIILKEESKFILVVRERRKKEKRKVRTDSATGCQYFLYKQHYFFSIFFSFFLLSILLNGPGNPPAVPTHHTSCIDVFVIHVCPIILALHLRLRVPETGTRRKDKGRLQTSGVEVCKSNRTLIMQCGWVTARSATTQRYANNIYMHSFIFIFISLSYHIYCHCQRCAEISGF